MQTPADDLGDEEEELANEGQAGGTVSSDHQMAGGDEKLQVFRREDERSDFEILPKTSFFQTTKDGSMVREMQGTIFFWSASDLSSVAILRSLVRIRQDTAAGEEGDAGDTPAGDGDSMERGDGSKGDGGGELLSESKKLGFGFKKWVSSNPPATGDFSATEGRPRFGETVAMIPSEKAGDLATDRAVVRAPPLLGFEAFSSSSNGGRRMGISPRQFNMAEFLSLASRVIDEGDADAMEALVALKSRWESRFGNSATATKQTTTMVVAPLPHGRRPIQARRCLLGPANEMRREDFISGTPSTAIGKAKGAGGATPLDGVKPQFDEDDGGPALDETTQNPARLCEALSGEQGDETAAQTGEKHSGAIFRRTGEQPTIFPTTSEVRRLLFFFGNGKFHK
ncbi:UNVERIFIED_CONTAM: hypothetical protein Sindi_3031400 [Sesamum indicum]